MAGKRERHLGVPLQHAIEEMFHQVDFEHDEMPWYLGGVYADTCIIDTGISHTVQ